MLIYGSKATQLAKETQFEKCKNCGTSNSVDLYVIQKYAHVFWIPFFPMSKTGVSQCSHCKQGLRLNEMPDSIRSSYDVLKRQSKAPAWTFIGVGLVAVLIVFGVISARQEDAENKKWVQDPKAGDVYDIKNNYDSYTVYKVDEVKGDTVVLLVSQFETNKQSGLGQIKRKGNSAWAEETETTTREAIKRMYENNVIVDVERH
jgi:hypothetical protein